MIEGKTKSGFEYKLDEDVFDDYELLQNISELSNGNDIFFVPVVRQLLGEEQEKRLKEFLRERDGKVKTTAMTAEVVEIMQNSKSAKNS